jgi:hypothetical protein
MDASDIFNRGASITRVINLTYEDTGLPIDTDDLDDILFSVINATTTRELDSFSYLGGTVTILNSTNGQVRFIVPQSVSALAKLGNYHVHAITHETDADYENNTHIRTGLSFCFKLML